LGESALKLPDPGQPFQFAFGPFKPLSVAFRKLSNREEQVGAFTRERQWTVKERVEFSNDSAEPLVVEVQDPLVVSAVDRVRVTALPETTPGHVEKSPGVRTWTLTIGPKATQSLALATQVRAPLEGQVSGLEAFGIR
jgi:hypothetical protein